MTYKIKFSREAEGEIRKLDNVIVEKILKKLKEAGETPYHFFERLSGREDYKLRIGDYRIIAKIMHSEKFVLIISIGHRKNVYKK